MNDFDSFFERNRPSLATRVAVALWFIFCAVVSIAFLGLIGWAIYELVTWVTTK